MTARLQPALERVGPEVALHHEHRLTVVGEAAEHDVSRRWGACFPIRIGGFDQIARNRRSGSTSSGATTRTFASAFDAALRSHSARARAFTSTAHTVAPGARLASVRATAPAPQPRSRRSPVLGTATALRSRMPVPVSSRPWLNTPRSVRSRNDTSGSTTSTSRSSDARSGSSSK
jgi:hypothetical protein